MPHLFCEEDGRAHEAETREEQSSYRDEGEAVVIVGGRLIGGPWHCDRCGAELAEGDAACLVSAFPARIVARAGRYDFAAERRYFAMEGKERVAVYGAAWPGMVSRA